jgi:hypothetical protein
MASRMYRWSLKVENVYDFCMFGVNSPFTCGTLASYKNEVSGFVKKENVRVLLDAVSAFSTYGRRSRGPVRLVTVDRYWKDYDRYN